MSIKSRELVLADLDRGLLPTREEQETLNLRPEDLTKRWVAGMQASADVVHLKEQEQWRSFFSNNQTLWDKFLAEGTEEQEVLFDVVERYYPKAWFSHVRAHYARRLGTNDRSAPTLERCSMRACMWSGKPDLWSEPQRALAAIPGLYCGDMFLNNGRTLLPDMGELIVMHTGCGQAEGVSIKHDGGRAVLITLTGVVGPWNFDPADGTPHFEPGSRTVQWCLAYRSGLPTARELLEDVLRMPEVKALQRRKTDGYRRDGKPTVAFHRAQ